MVIEQFSEKTVVNMTLIQQNEEMNMVIEKFGEHKVVERTLKKRAQCVTECSKASAVI